MQDVKNGSTIYVAKDIARQATTVIDDSVATYIKDGEVVLADLEGNVVTNVASTYTGKDRMCIYLRKGDKIYKSAPISAKNLKHYSVNVFSAATNKVVYLGYNGTDGDLEGGTFAAGSEFTVTLRDKELLGHTYDDYRKTKVSHWFSGSISDSQMDLASGLTYSLVSNYLDPVHKTSAVKVTMVSDATTVAAGSTVKFTDGNNVAVATGAHGLVACDFIKCGTGATDPVYKIKEVDGNLLILETPYQGASITITPNKLTNANVANFGIKFEGKKAYFEVGKYEYDLSNFEVFAGDLENTLLRVDTKAYSGNGVAEQIMEIEWELEQYEGVSERTDYLSKDRVLNTDLTKSYDIISVSTSDTMHADAISGRYESPYTIMVAIPVGSTQGTDLGAGKACGIATGLDFWLSANTSSSFDEDAKL